MISPLERQGSVPVESPRLKVACHAGQLLQPVPGGIGRYTHSLLRTLPAAGVEAVAFAAGTGSATPGSTSKPT